MPDELTIKEWKDVKGGGKWDLLLGNGFSCSISEKFSFRSLNGTLAADENSETRKTIAKIAALNPSQNLEVAQQLLNDLLTLKEVVNVDKEFESSIISLLKEMPLALLHAIGGVHVEYGKIKDRLLELKNQFKEFGSIYSLNYDLIPYWIIAKDFNAFTDCMRGDGVPFTVDDPHWRTDKIRVYYLHGSLFLNEHKLTGTGETSASKATLLTIDIKNLENHYKNNDLSPLFVSGGSADDKLERIRENRYLNFCYNQLKNSDKDLCIFGASLAENDQHIIDAIKYSASQLGSAIPQKRKIAISMRTESSKDLTYKQLARMYHIAAAFEGSDCDLEFFDASTHPLALRGLNSDEKIAPNHKHETANRGAEAKMVNVTT